MAHSQCQSDPLDWDGGGGESPPGAAGHRARISRFGLTSGTEADSLFTFFFSRLSSDLEMTFSTVFDIGHNCRLGLGLAQGPV